MGHKSVAILWIKLIYHHGTQQRRKAGSLEQRTCSSGHTSCKPFTQHMQFRAHLMQPFYAAHAIQGTPHATLLRSTCNSGHTSCNPFTQHMQFRAHLMQPFYAAHLPPPYWDSAFACATRSMHGCKCSMHGPCAAGIVHCCCGWSSSLNTHHAGPHPCHAYICHPCHAYTSCKSASLSCIRGPKTLCCPTKHIWQLQIEDVRGMHRQSSTCTSMCMSVCMLHACIGRAACIS